jgi:hypothetical protein
MPRAATQTQEEYEDQLRAWLRSERADHVRAWMRWRAWRVRTMGRRVKRGGG